MGKIYRNKNFGGIAVLVCSSILFIATFVLRPISFNDASLAHRVRELERSVQKLEADATLLVKDTALINRLSSSEIEETTRDLEFLYAKPYGFFLYKKSGNSEYLRFWNTALVMIPDSVLAEVNDEKFAKLANGYYYIKKINSSHYPRISIYCTVLIQSEFVVASNFFKKSFPLSTALDNKADISDVRTSFSIRSASGKTAIYLKQSPGAKITNDSVLFVIIRLISFFLIFLSLYILLFKFVVRRYKFADIPLFLLCIFSFRALLYICARAFRLDSLELFNPELYHASIFLPSLGDLLINSLLFCWIGIFIWNRVQPVSKARFYTTEGRRLAVGVAGTVLLLLLTYFAVNVIRSIISYSQVSFDVTNFFSLSAYTAVGFIILAFISLGFHFFTRIIYNYLFPAFSGRIYLIYLVISVAGLSFIAIRGTESVSLYLLCLLWLLFYTFLFNNEAAINKLIRFNISGIVVWIFIFSISISLLMLSEIDKAELRQRRIYLEKLDTKSDPASERLITMANTYLDNDFFLENFHRLYDPGENKLLRDSILSNNYSRYIKDYTGSLFFFDSTNSPLFNSNDLSYESINAIILRQSSPTGKSDLYFYEPSYDKFAYITYRRIKDGDGKLVGTVCIISQPKKFSPVNISPELFRQYSNWEFSNSLVYNYAIYSNKLLMASSKKYPFTSTLVNSQIPRSAFELRKNNGYSELWYNAGNNKIIVMTRKSERVLETITLFSYIFCAFLLLVALIQLVSNLLNFVLNRGALKKRLLISTSIRSQIHYTFILIALLSFIVIGVATISFFTQRFDDSNTEHLGRTMNIMLNEMQSYKDLGTLVLEQGDSASQKKLEDIIKRVADIHGVDVNIYNFKGNLAASSQPVIYQKGILSKQIDPRAYYYLFRLRHIEHTQKERVSDLKYTTMYSPLRNEDGTFSAYLSIPYFISGQVLNEEISRFLVTLINLNAFIFLITGLVALLITNRITHSFALIRDKLMEVNLSKHNEMIVWDRNDEIGGLVAEYNKMVSKLQVSADALAKSERQEAWREMARQVAHEIKNPLTPMKLSLQYLQKAINDKSPNVQQLTYNVSKTLVEQIDHLSKIAADFSQFANINQVSTEIFDLHEVIEPLIVIYSKNPDAEIFWNALPMPIPVFADRTQMNRVFTNLLSNAIEAVESGNSCKITINEKLNGDKVMVSITDNGEGISDEMKKKIFTPNFTTKTSGTGLGLAMCKSIIEQAAGEIYFETIQGKGTTFYILLPLIEK